MRKAVIDLTQDRVVQLVKMIAQNYKSIDSIVLFGSRARGDHGPKSDYDFAVRWQRTSENSADLWGSLQEKCASGILH
ncbi:MAG: nucleotidyltransferase domain-containing protein [Proteobacteria bacterium]|nr:nucleotidyltransferase domain-containing protein [Pseudomonadota bacterium]